MLFIKMSIATLYMAHMAENALRQLTNTHGSVSQQQAPNRIKGWIRN